MIVDIEIREVALAILKYNEDLVFIEELTEKLTMFVVIQTIYIWVVPYFSSTEGGVTMTLQTDAMYGELCQEVAL